MAQNRDVIFGRLIAIATVLGDRVFEKGTPSIASQYLDAIGREPAKYIAIIHRKLMNYAYKFGPEEMALIDMFGEVIDQLQIEEFNNKPLNKNYLIDYYKQKDKLSIVGYKEVYGIMGWDYKKNRSLLHSYLKRAEENNWPEDSVPKPIQYLASGPIWYKYQWEEYKDARN